MDASYKLTYFGIRGLAEPIRFLLAYGGIEYEDERIQKEDWPALKEGITFGQLPILTVNGKKFCQSTAIARFIGKKVKLGGKDGLEDMEIDGIVDTITDMRMKSSKMFYEPDETKKAALKETLLTETIPYYLDRFEVLMKKNNGYLACNKLTWADVYFVPQLENFEKVLGFPLSKYPNLNALREKVLAIPAIKKWVAKRPVTDM